MAQIDQTAKLADGRILGYAEFGDPSGTPILFFHGFPASRLEGSILDDACLKANIRLITPDRPGFGLSEPKPARSFLDWPVDVSGLAGHLGLYRFGILAVSESTPYALACALRIPEHISTIGLVSPMSPLRYREVLSQMRPDQRMLYRRAARCPMLARTALTRCMHEANVDFPAVMSRLMDDGPVAETSVLHTPRVQEMLHANLKEAFRQGVEAAVQEVRLWSKPWQLQWQDIRRNVLIWEGRQDTVTPPIMAEKLASLLPRTLTRWYPHEGHSLLFARAEQILEQLLS